MISLGAMLRLTSRFVATLTMVLGSSSVSAAFVTLYDGNGLPDSLQNYLFVGDDTSSAGADVVIGSIMLNSDLSAVPEPSGAALLLLAGWCGLTGTRWRQRRASAKQK